MAVSVRALTRLLLLGAAAVAVCVAQAPPSVPDFSSDGSAKVVALSGDVSVLHDSQPWALNMGDTVRAKQVIISGPDGRATFRVSDGSTFEVFPNSEIVFRANPPNWRDLLDVLVGRIRVHIQKMTGGNPNNVQTPSAVISVRGTVFDVSVDEEEQTTLVEVEEGQVEVRHRLKPGRSRLVNAGESLVVDPHEPIAQSRIDKGAVAQKVLRAMLEAVYTAVSNSRTGSSTGIPGGGGGGNDCPSCGSGNTHPPAPPPPTPPPPVN